MPHEGANGLMATLKSALWRLRFTATLKVSLKSNWIKMKYPCHVIKIVRTEIQQEMALSSKAGTN